MEIVKCRKNKREINTKILLIPYDLSLNKIK